jgi:tetratricopeptide (TPR) repeat protein
MGRDKTMLREILDKTEERVGKGLRDQPETEAELRSTIGGVYNALGQYGKAEEMHRSALVLRRALWGDMNTNVADSLEDLGWSLEDQWRTDEAESAFQEALTIRTNVLGPQHLKVAASMHSLARNRFLQTKPAEAESLYREALAMRRKLLGKEHPDVAASLSGLSRALLDQDKLDEAEATSREALAIQGEAIGNRTYDVVWIMHARLGLVLEAEGKLDEAESVERKSLAMYRKQFGPEHPAIADALDCLAMVLCDEGMLEEAEALSRESLAMYQKLLDNQSPLVADPLDTLGLVHRTAGRLAEAEACFREELGLRRKMGDERLDVAETIGLLDDVLLCEKKYGDAEQLFSEILTPTLQHRPQGAYLLRQRAVLFARRGRWNQAAADAAKAVEFVPSDHYLCRTLAPLLVITGNVKDYRRQCRCMVEQFAGTREPIIAARMAKGCLLRPDAGVDLVVVSRWADTAVDRGKEYMGLPSFQVVKGLAEYRQGRFDSAVEWAGKVLTNSHHRAASVISTPMARESPSREYCQVQAYLVSAMAHWQMQRTNEARGALAKGIQLAESKLPKLESGDLGDSWIDWILAQTLMAEAKALIEGQPSATVESSHL